MSTTRLCLPTLDPRQGGGVRSVTEFAYETATQAGYDSYLLYNAVDWDHCRTLGDVLTGNLTPEVTYEMVDGMESRRIGRVLPELEVGNYIFNQGMWDEQLSDGSVFLGIGGPCLSSLPLARLDYSFGCWIGTTIEDERDIQKYGYSLPQRVRYATIRPILRRFEHTILERADPILAQSEYTKQKILDRHDVHPDDIELLPVPVDTERYKPPEDDVVEDENIVIFVGRYSDPRKNIDLLMRAFAKLIQEVPSARLVLVGDDLGESHKSLTESLGISDRVESKGMVRDVVPFLQKADVFALPSHQEGLCISGLEAMSCGVPVVSTRCGGPEDYVIDGETGYLVPQDDAKALANRLAMALNGRVQSSLSNGARAYVVDHYQKEDVAEELEGVLNYLKQRDSGRRE